EHHRGPARAAEDLVEQCQLELAIALAAEVGAEVGGPQALLAHLFLQRLDRLAPGTLELGELLVGPHQVEGLDLLTHEGVGPVELLLELGIGLEVPPHVSTSPGGSWP